MLLPELLPAEELEPIFATKKKKFKTGSMIVKFN